MQLHCMCIILSPFRFNFCICTLAPPLLRGPGFLPHKLLRLLAVVVKSLVSPTPILANREALVKERSEVRPVSGLASQ
jgi:hypothetical protein